MQSYRDDSRSYSSRPLTSQLDPLPSDSLSEAGPSSSSMAASGANDLGKYQVRYEQSMNPFQAFRQTVSCSLRGPHLDFMSFTCPFHFFQEATRAYESLNRLERGVLVLTRGILSNRRTRTFVICYALALHAIVFYTSYECSPSSTTHVQY
jgi:homeobox protein cut-like